MTRMYRQEFIVSPSGFARSHLFYPLIGGHDVSNDSFYFQREHYPAYEILFITKGKGWVRQDNEWIALTPGDCFIHDMHRPHAYRSDPSDPMEMLYLVFNGFDMERIWNTWFGRPYVLLHECRPEEPFLQSLRTILEWMPIDNPNSEPAASSLIYHMLTGVLTRFRSAWSDNRTAAPKAIDRGRAYLDQNFAGDADIEKAARAAGLSYYHFIRQFKRYYGCTPKDYLNRKKINHSKRLLLLTDLSVTELAEKSGFSNYNTFLHSFLQHEGCSPSVFRKMWQRTSMSTKM